MTALSNRLLALDEANRVRYARGHAKRELAAGAITLADALDLECVQSMTVHALVAAQRRWGVRRSSRLLEDLRISETRRVRALTVRERSALVSEARRSWRNTTEVR